MSFKKYTSLLMLSMFVFSAINIKAANAMNSSYLNTKNANNITELANSSVANESDFEFDANTGTITKYVGSDTKVVIPNTIHGVSVTAIGDSSFWNCGIDFKSITIPNGVNSIGADAFNCCRSLTSITMPKNLKSIGKDAFGGCSSLTSITIPNSVTSIGIGAFNNCTNLKSITIPNGITRIEDSTFWACINLTNITIPKSVTSIGNDAFNCCRKLGSIVIPNSVTSIEKDAFGGCSSLKNIIIPNGVTNIGIGAFNNCTNLKSIIIPDSVISIGDRAFYACDNTVFNVNSEQIKKLLINSNVDESKIILKGQSVVTSITLNKKNLKLVVGKTENLVAKVAPSKATNKEVTWTSSDERIAAVDQNGKVTAIGTGTVTITCTANDGSGKAAMCNVTVNEAEYLKVIEPATDGVTSIFQGFNILFDNNIKVPSDWSAIKIRNSEGVEVPITYVNTTISKRQLQVYCESITNGEYTLFIPANTISDISGKKYNKEINIRFNIKLALKLDGTKDGQTFKIKGINLSFNTAIKAPEDWSAIKVKNSQGVEVPITDVHITSYANELQIDCDSMTNGQYALFIPAGTVSDTSGQIYNDDISIRFNVKLAK